MTLTPNRIIEWRGKPGTIRVDTGPDYISGKLLEWAEKHRVLSSTSNRDSPGRTRTSILTTERLARSIHH
jgi:putative transposase